MKLRGCAAVLAGALIGLTASHAAGQGVIEIRPSVRSAITEPLCLEDLAVLEGAEAKALAKTVIVPAAERTVGAVTLTLEQIRAALESAGRPNWGRLTLRGSRCQVLPPAAIATPKTPESGPGVPKDATGTVRAAAAARIAQIARAEPGDVQLAFNPDDNDFLNQPTAGRTVEARATAVSDRLPLAITVYDHDRIVASRTIRVGVQVRRSVVIATVDKRRGDTVQREDLTEEMQWTNLSTSPATMDQLVGAVVRTKVPTGQAFTAEDVSPPIIVNKGDQVIVNCISGSVVLTTKGRALAAARDGEMVEFQALDSKRRFTARMNGRGRAVVTTTEIGR